MERTRLASGFPALWLALIAPAGAVEMLLQTTDPYPSADGLCALVEALDNANGDAATHADCPAGSGADAIELDGQILSVDGAVLYPASNPVFFDTGDSGLPEIVSDVTLRNGVLERVGALPFRFFVVQTMGSLTLQQVTLSNGRAMGQCGSSGGDFSGCGGAVVTNNGSLLMDRSVISNSSAVENAAADVPKGGAIMAFGGTLNLSESTLSGNLAELGGAIGVQFASAEITDCVFDANQAVTSGGGIYNGFGGSLLVAGTSFLNNQVQAAFASFTGGGAIDNAGSNSQLTVINSDFVGNLAPLGGALHNFNASDAYISNSRFSGNTANSGGAIMNHGSGATVNLYSVVVDDNSATSRGGGIANGITQTGIARIFESDLTNNQASSHGGGIATLGQLSLRNALLDNNSGSNGGGVYVGSGGNQTVTVESSALSSNFASRDGGGLYYNQNPTGIANSLAVTDSRFDGNEADQGGGLYGDYVDVTLHRSSFSNNISSQAGFGGGGGVHLRCSIVNGATVEIENVTVSGNTAAQDGGGLYVNGSAIDVSLASSTIVNNSANSTNGGDGIHSLAPIADLTVRDSIVAGNGNRNCIEVTNFGVTDGGDNISDDSSCGFADNGGGVGDGVDPMTDPLAYNGGLSLTHSLNSLSPAIDEGSIQCAAVDQRGAARTGVCDIGAFESTTPPAVISVTVDNPVLREAMANSATITVSVDNTDADSRPVDILVALKVTGNASGLGIDYTLDVQDDLASATPGQITPLAFSVPADTLQSQTVTVTIIDDDRIETSESLTLQAQATGYAVFADSGAAALLLLNDDFDGDDVFADSFEDTAP